MCKHHGEASLNPWANIIENHQEETLAHWESHFTNTCIEELVVEDTGRGKGRNVLIFGNQLSFSENE